MQTSTTYPIGKFTRPESLTAEQRAACIETIVAFPDELAAVLKASKPGDFLKTYREGGWNVLQIVHHCADSHMNAFVRFKLALTEDNPTITGYHQDAWANLADVLEADVYSSVLILMGLHKRWATLLLSLTDAQWQRKYFHPENQHSWTLDQALAQYDWHCRHHLEHVKIAVAK